MSPVLAGEFFTTSANWECVDHKKLWKILKEMGIPDYLSCLMRNLYVGQEATVMEQWTDSKLEKEYDKVIYCHPVYSTYMQSTSCEMPG